jgi:hypothetical protein
MGLSKLAGQSGRGLTDDDQLVHHGALADLMIDSLVFAHTRQEAVDGARRLHDVSRIELFIPHR